jgi:riboflavin kinase / FMN adenylyltransferase
MRILHRLALLKTERRPICLAAGFFDGVHAGHQQVLSRAVQCARHKGGSAWAMTFDRHPLKVLKPNAAPPLLTATPHKITLMGRLGLDGCLVVPFTRTLANMAPAAFLDLLSQSAPTLRHVFVGTNWHFGRQGRGDTALLTLWLRAHGIRVTAVPPLRWRRQPVSSTRLRAAIEEGDLAAATAMLGRPFSILGTVVAGRRIGRQLGYPTANLVPHNEVRPPVGVYAVRAIHAGRSYEGLLNYGFHPTVQRAPEPLFELHLLDTARELYGQVIEVFFFRRLRGERRFGARRDLVVQIRRDIQEARRVLSMPRLKKSWKMALQTWHPDTIVAGKER